MIFCQSVFSLFDDAKVQQSIRPDGLRRWIVPNMAFGQIEPIYHSAAYQPESSIERNHFFIIFLHFPSFRTRFLIPHRVKKHKIEQKKDGRTLVFLKRPSYGIFR